MNNINFTSQELNEIKACVKNRMHECATQLLTAKKVIPAPYSNMNHINYGFSYENGHFSNAAFDAMSKVLDILVVPDKWNRAMFLQVLKACRKTEVLYLFDKLTECLMFCDRNSEADFTVDYGQAILNHDLEY